jgi:nucleotide-binding universal stress UspA family protein
MEGFKKILYPIALTKMSPRIAPYVAVMAKQFDADLCLLHVLRRFDWFVNTYVSQPPKPDFKRIASDFESQITAQAEQNLAAFVKKHFKGVRIAKTDIVVGTDYEEIIHYVESEKIDLIIMGSGTTLQKVMFGSVAEKVSRLAGVPVMLIKGGSLE